ncbi:uncharacterized protein MELLADRAFT_92204 [Melampsora larici-populina 98AG31]|uniref:Uncharacterized protein n=1 Tax=Melampsora larici-populina (strain 98AG31 / pathotype 3-4-7) TaxID=747676 RepID=F4R8S5_MELLP|nr:uncharacterized protein MELLADRAFT_92204 [Melampsora larici-populina 98AG31]EGG10857.1 hypothetical protein MELLADRAFT_92204 [Melampsora larici-populina 98AG31]
MPSHYKLGRTHEKHPSLNTPSKPRYFFNLTTIIIIQLNLNMSNGNGIVSHLESIADSYEQRLFSQNNTQPSTQSQPTGTQDTVTATSQSKKSRSNNKNKRKRSENQPLAEANITVEDIQAMNKSSVELRCLAKKHAQSGMTQEVLRSILKFHEEIQTLVAIKALELGTTVSTIEEIFGKYLGVRQPSAWNGFLQSELAKAIFKAGNWWYW